jgi:Uso1 / p115 like vesicle tethering protein, head region
MFSIIHEFNDDYEAAFSKANLQSLVISRIGIDVFKSRIQRLKDSKAFGNVAEIAVLLV